MDFVAFGRCVKGQNGAPLLAERGGEMKEEERREERTRRMRRNRGAGKQNTADHR